MGSCAVKYSSFLFNVQIVCDNDAQGIQLKVSLFDFTANDFSAHFKSCYAANTFVECYEEIVCGRREESTIQEDSSPKEDVEKPSKKRARTSTTDQ